MKATHTPIAAPAHIIRIQPEPVTRPDWYVAAMVASIDAERLATVEGLVVEQEWRRHMRAIDRAVDVALTEMGATEVQFWRRIDGRVGYYRRRVRA